MSTSVYAIKNGKQNENAYLVTDENKNTLIIDPGSDPHLIIESIEKKGLNPIAIIATHAHWDHISATSELTEHYNIPFALHPLDLKLLKSLNLYRWMIDKIPFGKIPTINIQLENEVELVLENFKIIPYLIGSHTKGSVLIQIENHLFSGDIIFKGAIDEETKANKQLELIKIIEKISNLAEDITVYPGHGTKTQLKSELQNIKDLK